MAEPTIIEQRLIEQYVSVLDYVSRCAQAVDGGNWDYLWDKAEALEYVAGRLKEAAAEARTMARDGKKGAPRREVVRAAVAAEGRHYRAGRLLHPLDDQSSEAR